MPLTQLTPNINPNKTQRFELTDADFSAQYLYGAEYRRATSISLAEFAGCRVVHILFSFLNPLNFVAKSICTSRILHRYTDENDDFVFGNGECNFGPGVGTALNERFFAQWGYESDTNAAVPGNIAGDDRIVDPWGQSITDSANSTSIANAGGASISQYSRLYITYQNPTAAADFNFTISGFQVQLAGSW